MDLDQYNRSFEEHVLTFEEEAEARLAAFRQKCIRDFIQRLTRQQDEWQATFRELLDKSQEEIPELARPVVTFAEQPSVRLIDNEQPPAAVQPVEKSPEVLAREREQQQQRELEAKQAQARRELEEKAAAAAAAELAAKQATAKGISASDGGDRLAPPDPFPQGHEDYFTNSLAVREFTRIQEQQERNRQLFQELNTSPALKPLKNELTLYIRTQINSISNSDQHHLSMKSRTLTNLFLGQPVIFQERQICAAKHPQGQLYAMDLAAQTFVTVGTKLVNSVPAIARSMATVIEGIVRGCGGGGSSGATPGVFRDLILGHLQERCPYLVPMYPQLGDFSHQPERHKMACGYTLDFATKSLESEDKYLARMRSMALIFACVLVTNSGGGLPGSDPAGHAWSWLASFLSLRPEPVITPTILQAFLQGGSRALARAYRRQYAKLLAFMQTDFVTMIEQVTDKPGGRQPLTKLKNQLSEDYKSALM